MISEKMRKDLIRNTIYSYKERLNLNVNEKRSIVGKAINFIHKNKRYFFDVSTSVQFLAADLNKQVTIFTHSLDNFNILSEKENVLVNLISGEFNNKNRFFYRTNYEKCFEEVEFDAAFLGAGAIRSDGIYYENEEDAFIKREVVKRSKKVILLAEHQKYEKTAEYKGLGLEQANIIIVDPISISLFGEIIESQNIKINPNSLVII
ncbi:DeoR/GlpR family DNA-binding transcription regulator [Clostridium sp.]|uniref:DeoR/GlpR family DNA-binding transcription regulator n=1 Tax=Clostridium sp. TaxID=1506 RepID=UPI0028482F49|nr:DeoR/GlpR family DNA-binding transcription regulator [Clostridium sp.]MDR3598380.1 DeoR/GlpR family DNA-binding transcription regulator [Clostridium sp.]